jgi:hypothetical protein
MKRVIIFTALLAFATVAIPAFAANESFKGIVTKIGTNEVTLSGDAGKVMVVKEAVSGLKVGDKVTVSQGKIIRDGIRIETNPQLNPQPEPPKPVKSTNVKVSTKINPGQTQAPATPEQPTPPPKQTTIPSK